VDISVRNGLVAKPPSDINRSIWYYLQIHQTQLSMKRYHCYQAK